MFCQDYSSNVLRANWEYYEPRTEHGSSLSAGMYAMLACKIGEPDRAYPFFLKSAMADLKKVLRSGRDLSISVERTRQLPVQLI